MALLQEDRLYLDEKGYKYEPYVQADGNVLLVIKDYSLPPIYTTRQADVLVMIPPMYPMAQMDMFWLYPEVRLVNSNRYPVAADYFQDFLGLRWQRFSRHYTWRPGLDSLTSHLKMVQKSLDKPE